VRPATLCLLIKLLLSQANVINSGAGLYVYSEYVYTYSLHAGRIV